MFDKNLGIFVLGESSTFAGTPMYVTRNSETVSDVTSVIPKKVEGFVERYVKPVREKCKCKRRGPQMGRRRASEMGIKE